MSGHSKWSTIKRQKEVQDAKRGQLFSKLARAITIASRQGGRNPESNLALKVAIDKAIRANMPKQNIERAMAKGSSEGETIEKVLYEGYGPDGIAVLVSTATDNKNRTAQEIKNIFARSGGRLAGPGSVSFQFEQAGQIVVKKGNNPEATMLKLIDLGAEDIEEVEDGIEIYTKPSQLYSVKEKIEKAGMEAITAEIIYRPKEQPVSLNKTKTEKAFKLLETLFSHNDVQQVYANIKI